MLDSETVEAAKYTAELRLREDIREACSKLSTEVLSSLDAIIYSSCGGDLPKLIAEAAMDSLCSQLGQNPIDLVAADHKNSTTPEEGLFNG